MNYPAGCMVFMLVHVKPSKQQRQQQMIMRTNSGSNQKQVYILHRYRSGDLISVETMDMNMNTAVPGLDCDGAGSPG